jgi:hypothetical protein
MKNKFWDHVEDRLITREGSIYFAGRTLCVDFDKGGIGMNLDGKGFVYGGCNAHRKNSTVYLPDYITDMVRRTYVEYKENRNKTVGDYIYA